MTRLDEVANESAELGCRIASVIHDRLHVMRDAHSGLPGAASYEQERTSGHTTRKFCERCQSDPKDCKCQRPVITTYPAVSDPVGEAAVTPDRARDDRRALERHLLAAYRANDAAAKILERYAKRAPSEKDRAETAKANEQADPGCTSCARTFVAPGIKRFEYAIAKGLCRWCADYERATGRLPTEAELEQHHRGQKVRRPA